MNKSQKHSQQNEPDKMNAYCIFHVYKNPENTKLSYRGSKLLGTSGSGSELRTRMGHEDVFFGNGNYS